eukprot:Em0022g809a
MANAKPLLLPEVFGGEPQSWTEWLEHFESVAAINKWESAEEKMKWLKVRITGQARMAFRKFPASVQTKYEECTKAFKQRFEPDSKKELYRAELTTRTRRRDEDWATYGDVLRTLADKAYSDLEEKARERLALGQFLSNIENPQVAFGVRQKCPETLDAAVRMTIELESYLKITTTPTPVVAAATSADESKPLSKALQLLNERLDKLEVMVVSKSNPSSQEKQDTDRAKDAGKRGPICWNCGKRGHIARRCWSSKNSKQQENFKPSMFNGSFVIASDLWVEAIVGLDFIRAHKCVIDCSNNTISFKSADVSVELLSPKAMEEMSSTVRSIGLVTTERILVPPECEMELMVTPVDNTVRALGGVWMVENDSKLSHGVIVARAITCPSDGLVPIRILNPRECSIELKKGTELAKMDHIEQGSILNVSVTTSRESSTTNQLLWEMVNKVGDCLGTKEKEQLYVLLQEYADVFCFRSNELGRTSVLRHHINIENASPIHQLPRRVPQARREEVRRLLREMLDNGVIEPSDSSWSSPVVLAKKKDGSLRFCVDYRKDTLGGSKFFTTLDLASGYWQVEVATEDRPKTAFVTPEGLFQFKVMPFGLCNAPATFQRLMDRVLGGLKWSSCLVYFDDIIVIGSTFSEHLKHLAAVLTHLRQSGLKLNPTKCKLCQQQVTFLTIIGPVFAAVKSGRRPLADQMTKLQLVLPYSLHCEVLKELHEGAVGGHLGESKMLGRLKERFYWPSCSEAVSDWCKSCIKCATRKTTVPKPRAGLQTIRAGYPMQIVCVDIMGPLPETERRSKYVLVVADYYTKWVEVYGIPNQEATTVAVKLVDEMFCRFSPPEQLHSDQGRQFESQLIKEICNLLHIRKSHTTPYRPQGNGMVERFNRTLLDMLATVVGDHPSDWEMYIRKLCFAYNTSTHSSTGFTPFYLMFGRQASIPVDLMFPFNLGPEKELRTYVEQLRKGLRDAYAIVRENCDADHRRQKALYDRKVSGQPFGKGALVWLFDPAVPRGKCKKLHHPWKGPFVVVEKVGDSTYKIQRKEGGKFHIVHFDRLKRCNLSESRDDPTPLPTPPLTAHPDGDGNIEEKDELVLLNDDDDDDDNLDREIAEQIIPERNLLGQGQAVAEVPLANPEAAETIRRYPARHRRAPDRYGPYVSF